MRARCSAPVSRSGTPLGSQETSLQTSALLGSDPDLISVFMGSQEGVAIVFAHFLRRDSPLMQRCIKQNYEGSSADGYWGATIRFVKDSPYERSARERMLTPGYCPNT